ncbi:MAG: CARDB domain-containing protein [Deltaproteobacteria bacterium]|nr:CARDB domain-containing protein [Deltaproteobacteria bacterium]
MSWKRIVVCLAALGVGAPALAQDLIVTELAAPPSAPAGTPFEVTVTVENQGTVDAGAFAIRIWSDDHPVVTTSCDYLGRTVVASLPAGASLPVTFEIQSPGDYRDDVYYLAAKVDAEGDVDETDEDNNWLEQDTMTFEVSADITIRSASIPSSAAAGALVKLQVTLANEGTGTVCCFDLGVFLSDNEQVTNNDTRIHTRWIGNLLPGEGDQITVAFSLPEELPLGTYQLGLLADLDDRIPELDETNNAFTAPFQVRNPSGRLVFVTPPRVLGPSECSPPIRVQAQDLEGNPRPPPEDTKITLIRSSLYTRPDPLCARDTDFAVLEASSNLATFYVDYPHPGRRTVEVTAPELISARQTQLIVEAPEEGGTYVTLDYVQLSRKAVAGQAVRLQLSVTVPSELPLEEVVIQPAHVGLQTLAIDGVPVSGLDGSVVVGAMQAGDQRTFEIEAMPELGRLSASSLVVVGFGLEGSSEAYEVVSPQVDLVITGRGGGAECGTPGGEAPAALLAALLGGLLLRRRRR